MKEKFKTIETNQGPTQGFKNFQANIPVTLLNNQDRNSGNLNFNSAAAASGQESQIFGNDDHRSATKKTGNSKL